MLIKSYDVSSILIAYRVIFFMAFVSILAQSGDQSCVWRVSLWCFTVPCWAEEKKTHTNSISSTRGRNNRRAQKICVMTWANKSTKLVETRKKKVVHGPKRYFNFIHWHAFVVVAKRLLSDSYCNLYSCTKYCAIRSSFFFSFRYCYYFWSFFFVRAACDITRHTGEKESTQSEKKNTTQTNWKKNNLITRSTGFA